MSYMRVIPRDLFNEANLLKCYGQIYINLEIMGKESCLHHKNDTEPFHTSSNEDGCLTLDNVKLVINDEEIRLERPLNSRDPWPLYAVDYDYISLFDNKGMFTSEFKTLLNKEKINDTV